MSKDATGRIVQYLCSYDRSGYKHPINTADYLSYISNKHYEKSQWEIKKFAAKLKQIVALMIGCTPEQLEDEDFKNTELGKEWWYYKGEQTDKLFPYDTPYEANKKLPLVKATPRLLLQLIGTECGRQIIHPNVWVNSLFADYKELFESGSLRQYDDSRHYPNWIITDVRFPNEAEAIRERGGILIRIDRTVKQRFPKEWEFYKKHTISKTFNEKDFMAFWEEINEDFYKKINHKSEISLDDYDNFDYIISNTNTFDDLILQVKDILIQDGTI